MAWQHQLAMSQRRRRRLGQLGRLVRTRPEQDGHSRGHVHIGSCIPERESITGTTMPIDLRVIHPNNLFGSGNDINQGNQQQHTKSITPKALEKNNVSSVLANEEEMENSCLL